jgi:hypothetical protein
MTRSRYLAFQRMIAVPVALDMDDARAVVVVTEQTVIRAEQ